jgi:aspartate aminotransferase/aminotransferase
VSSARVAAIPESVAIWMNQLVADLRRAGREFIVLSSGEAHFEVPWFGIDPADVARGNQYSDSRGIPDLRARIAEYHRRVHGMAIDPARELLITAGSKMAIYLALLALLDPGDEVVIQEPAWVSYYEQVHLVGGTLRLVPYDVDVRELPGWFGPRTRLAIVNNPNNPAGLLYDRATLLALHCACRDRGVELLVDEAYGDFVADDAFVSLGAVVPDLDGAIVVNSLSKNLGVAGWRIGYAVARPALIDALLKLNQHLITCAPTLLQLYLARHFDALLDATLPQARAVAEKRARVARTIDQLGLMRLPGTGTFYFFVSIGAYAGTSAEFAVDLLLEDGVSVVPGSAYGTSTDRFVRVSIGAESEERIARALEALRRRIDQPVVAPGPVERLRALGLRAFEAEPA